MRGGLLSLALVLAVLLTEPSKSIASSVPTSATLSVVALQQEAPPASPPEAQQAPSQAPDEKINITVDQHRTADGGWYRNPVWIAIGALAMVIVLLLIVMIAKGSDTTVIHH